MSRQLAILLFFALFAVSSPAQETNKEQGNIPAKVDRSKNPIAPSTNSIAEGKRVFLIDCAMCHGEQGDGKGKLAATLRINPQDFRDETAINKLSDERLFDTIKKGKGGMPPEGDRVSKNQIWDVVNYIRTFANKASPPAAN